MKHISIINKFFGLIATIICSLGITGCSTDVPKLLEEGKNAFYNGEYVKAKNAFKQCANADDPEGLFWLANLTNYVSGHYSDTDTLAMSEDEMYKYTLKLYEKAAEKNYGDAFARIAYYYRDGIGVNKDENKYHECIDKSIELNSASGKAMRGGVLLDEGKYDEAHKLIKESADAGDYFGKCLLGRCYVFGTGIEEDINKGMDLLQESASHKDRDANNTLASIYFSGYKSVKDDKEKAFKYAKEGSMIGGITYIIAYCYTFGEGVEKDERRGAFFSHQSALQGDAYGQRLWADYCDSGYGTKQEAFEYYMKAADQDNVWATTKVGEYLLKGTAGRTDYTQAKRYLTKAASQGSKEAQDLLSSYSSILNYY